MAEATEEIKNKLDIAEFLRGYLTLVPAGKNFKALCPFHKEKTPSFMISPDRQSWHCFGSCNEGGDIFAFLMKYENIEFFEALKILAEKAGIELKRSGLAEQRQFGVLYDIQNAARDFWRQEFVTSPAVEYLKKRGLKPDTIDEYEIGFAPQKPDALTIELINKGFAIGDIERSGLVFKSDRGGYLDRFRGRIMFPIENHLGKIVGFTGRILPEFDNGSTGKYINSPETPIFKKSKIFYGFSRSKANVREAGELFLVEGQMDFLMAWQDGVKNIAATSGTALTPDHLETLKKYAERLVLSFDSDDAGMNAADRAIDLAYAHDFDVRILFMPDGLKDPADVVEKKTGYLKEAIAKSVPAMDFYMRRYLGEVVNKKNVRAVLAKIKNLESPIDRDSWIHVLCAKTGYGESALVEEMGRLHSTAPDEHKYDYGANRVSNLPNTSPGFPFEGLPSTKTRQDLIAETLLVSAARRQKLEFLAPFLEYMPAVYRSIYDALVNPTSNTDPAIAKLADYIDLGAGGGLEHDESELVRQLKLEHLREQKTRLLDEIRNSQKMENDGAVADLMKQFDLISKEIHNTEIK